MSARVAWAMSGEIDDPATYSGLPTAICRGFDECGLPVTAVSAQLPGGVRRLVDNLATVGFIDGSEALRRLVSGRSPRLVFRDNKPKLLPSREMTALRSATVARRLRAIGPVDGVIQFGCEYSLPAGKRYVTLDDATIQALRTSWPYEWMQMVPERSLNRMIARQQRIFRQAHACCVLTHWAARSAIEDYGVSAQKIIVVGCGSNRDVRAVERDHAVPRFLFVGRNFERKNGHALLSAFSHVRERHPYASLDVVGEHPPISQSGVTGHGPLGLDDPEAVLTVNRLFERATCFVMPSRFEPNGNVFAEALTAGIGSIGTIHGGSSTVIGPAGVTVDPDDEYELTASMERFCDPEQSLRFAARALERAPLFTWRSVAERIIGALQLPGFDRAILTAPL